jgi:hypothetical protein
MRHWIIGLVVFGLLAIGITGAIWGGDDWGPNHDSVITRSVSADGSEVIVIHDGNRHFFPFGILIFPLVAFGFLFCLRAFAFRGRWGGPGPWMRGGPHAAEVPERFEEWHRRAHAGDPSPPDQPAAS